MELSLIGKFALVNGASAGLGLASAVELASLGATVIIMARNEEKLNVALKTLPCPNGQIHRMAVANMDDLAQVSMAVELVLSENPIHILVNNTGGPPAGPVHTAEIHAFESAFKHHLLGNHLLATSVLPGMKQAGYGRIINIISTSVKVPLKGLGVSNTIRGAVGNWSKTLANEVAAWGITVNNVLPGATETERLSSIIEGKAAKTGTELEHVRAEMIAEIPAARFGKPSEIGHAVAFLASPAASYINGINIPVDGGRTPNL
jgi:3-oxoacyl-[acyl-carrier protein] reductase